MATSKKKLGQFFTTNYHHILKGMIIPDDIKTIIEPFCGNGDLLNFIEGRCKEVVCYDIEPKKPFIIKRDTIKNPPDYSGLFIITNPPYLARNKTEEKDLFDKYEVNDLYKCFIKEIIINPCLGGIIIIPLNFWSSIRPIDIKLRQLFLEKYSIILLNIFEEQVFDDTTYTICSFQFELRKEGISNQPFRTIIYPSGVQIEETDLNNGNNYMIGGEIYNLKSSGDYKITRLTNKNKEKANTNILVKCIDDNDNNRIGLTLVEDNKIYIDETPNQTARTYATLIIEPTINKEKQLLLVNNFNNYLNNYRKKYNSLFLTNYREKERKRISFELVYSICAFILDNFF